MIYHSSFLSYPQIYLLPDICIYLVIVNYMTVNFMCKRDKEEALLNFLIKPAIALNQIFLRSDFEGNGKVRTNKKEKLT